MRDDNYNFDGCNDCFDEKTFQLELQVADLERREAAWRTLVLMQRLARIRAREQNITFDAAWRDIFDPDLFRGEMIGSNEKRAQLASKVWDALDNLRELRSTRRHLLPAPKWARASSSNTNNNTTASGGVRAA
jgi:hypothetical protein